MVRAACTIVSLNYLPYARALSNSFLRYHPGCNFYVLVVDRIPENVDLSNEEFKVVPVESLGIHDFESVAFKYDILELNTNVKPTFLQMLLKNEADELIYLDPDIFIYAELDPIFERLERHAIVLTPHLLFPSSDDRGRREIEQLRNGIYNLGFIALRKGAEAENFLTWWEERCLNFAYARPQDAMFVDQKWIDLAPVFFDSVTILRHPGCNVAYWNLHERHFTRKDDVWIVNDSFPLLFFHFSGASVDGKERISKYTDSHTLSSRPELRPLFEDYRQQLTWHGIRQVVRNAYAFCTFDNGQRINSLTRLLYAANLYRFRGENPFQSSSSFYRWARSKNLLSKGEQLKRGYTATQLRQDKRVRFMNTMLRLVLRILGPDRYSLLMRYFAYASVLENQREVLGE